MRKLIGCAIILLAATVSARADFNGTPPRVEQASPGKPYDLVVYVRNVPDYGYNPEVREDRIRMALKLVRQQCPAARAVGEHKVVNEIFGIGGWLPDYIVLVRCN